MLIFKAGFLNENGRFIFSSDCLSCIILRQEVRESRSYFMFDEEFVNKKLSLSWKFESCNKTIDWLSLMEYQSVWGYLKTRS